MKATDTPTANDAAILVRLSLDKEPTQVRRLLTGLCHYVFSVSTSGGEKFVVRIATLATKRLLAGGVYWNNFLRPIGVPLPKILAAGLERSEIPFPFVILESLAGTDLCAVYQTLSSNEKLEIVSELVRIQQKVSELPQGRGFGHAHSYTEPPEHRNWEAVVVSILQRAERRMSPPTHPGSSYIERASQVLRRHEGYFANIRPTPFLDDTTTKNVLVDQGRLSGVVDVDQICFGDPLLTVGLTQTALLGEGFDVDYIEQWMNLLKLSKQQRQAVAAYSLLFSVDFMSELGQRFNRTDEPAFDLEKFARLKSIFDGLAE